MDDLGKWDLWVRLEGISGKEVVELLAGRCAGGQRETGGCVGWVVLGVVRIGDVGRVGNDCWLVGANGQVWEWLVWGW